MMNIIEIKNKLLNSKFFKDSFWAVFGNGIGNALMLFAGILIARFLGKDLYGEYGVVKTTMFYIASFATLGLGFTSTKYIANAIQERPSHIKSIVRCSMSITLAFSGLIAFLLLCFAHTLANYLGEESLTLALRALAVVILFKAITTTQIGLLSGFKDFKHIAYNSLYSGLFMLILCIPLTYFFSLQGALISLLFSQMFNCLINYFSVRKYTQKLVGQEMLSYSREMIKFSFPVALQESSYTICNWAAIMFLTKYASMGDVGVYSACAQWNSIILMIPSLLSNVVLSYLSGVSKNSNNHIMMLKKMILINLLCTIVPFLIVYFAADFISSFYGASFMIEMPVVLRILTFTTILEACASVLKSEYIAQGRTWLIFILRAIRDICLVTTVYILLSNSNGENGAVMYSWAFVGVSVAFFLLLVFVYRLYLVPQMKKE